MATMPKMVNGRNVALFSICPALVSSTKPMMAAKDVLFTRFTRNPTVGAVAKRSACGATTRSMRGP